MTSYFPFPLEITPEAVEQAWQVLCSEGSARVLRVYVQGGGCSGFSYGFAICDKAEEDDHVWTMEPMAGGGHTFQIAVDPMSAPMLAGAKLDWKDELFERTFVITNPNAVTTCGCGSSFSI